MDPNFVFRDKKWFTCQLALGKTLKKGPQFPGDKDFSHEGGTTLFHQGVRAVLIDTVDITKHPIPPLRALLLSVMKNISRRTRGITQILTDGSAYSAARRFARSIPRPLRENHRHREAVTQNEPQSRTHASPSKRTNTYLSFVK